MRGGSVRLAHVVSIMGLAFTQRSTLASVSAASAQYLRAN